MAEIKLKLDGNVLRGLLLNRASKPALKSTEGVAALVIATLAVLQAVLGIGIDISDAQAMTIAAGAVALHQVFRGITKAWAVRTAGQLEDREVEDK